MKKERKNEEEEKAGNMTFCETENAETFIFHVVLFVRMKNKDHASLQTFEFAVLKKFCPSKQFRMKRWVGLKQLRQFFIVACTCGQTRCIAQPVETPRYSNLL